MSVSDAGQKRQGIYAPTFRVVAVENAVLFHIALQVDVAVLRVVDEEERCMIYPERKQLCPIHQRRFTLIAPCLAVVVQERTLSRDEAIVYLDVSAQNSFGGWVRSEYYVCIQSIKSDGTFTYSSTVPYTDEKSSYDILLMLNDFGDDPAAEELEGLLFEDGGFVRIGVAFAITPTQSLECYKLSFEYGTQYAYVDTNTNKIVSVRMTFKNTSGDFEDSQKICAASIAALTDTSTSRARENAANVINLSNFTPTGTSNYYYEGFVYDYDAGITVTLVNEDSYKSGLYWSPKNEMAYYEKLADQYAESKDFDNAIVFYEQADIRGDKLNAAYVERFGTTVVAKEIFTEKQLPFASSALNIFLIDSEQALEITK